MNFRVPLLVLSTQILLLVGLRAEMRVFTSTDGRTIKAQPVKVTADSAVLKRPAVGNVTVPLSALSSEDQIFLKQWAEKEKANRIPKIDVAEGETHKVTGKLVKFEYDKDGYKHGEKYTGYLFELRNAQGKVIERRGSTPRVENDAELILKLRENDHFDERTFAKVNNAVRR